LQDALRLVGRAEQCGAGLALKLQKRGHGSSVIKETLSSLTLSGMVDDERFARLWLESRLKRKSDSPRELGASLRKKGIDGRTASRVLKDILDEETEYELVRRFIGKQGGFSGGESVHILRKRLRFEGFSAETLDRLAEGGA
jgi:regulatory protein